MNNLVDLLRQTKLSIPLCSPPIWANGGHLQTILGHLIPSASPSQPGAQLNIPLDNEAEKIHSTYLKGTSNIAVSLFHGLGGSSEAGYMKRTALLAQSLGHHVFLHNHRGCGKGVRLSKGTYHSGRSEDLSSAIGFAKKMLPGHLHVAVGFSLSGNALLLLSAGIRAKSRPDVALVINAPLDLDQASRNLQKGLNKIYDKRFTNELKKYLNDNNLNDNNLNQFSSLMRVKDLRDFDELYTAPLGGFKNRTDYYEQCSANKYLHQIDIPTLIIMAEDDPFISFSDYQNAQFSPTTVLHFEKKGGHMGYLTQNGFSFTRWLDIALKHYLLDLSLYRK